MNVAMQALTAAAFSATAALLVLNVPNPAALIDILSPASWQHDRVEDRDNEIETLAEELRVEVADHVDESRVIQALNDCAFYLDRSPNPSLLACAEALDMANTLLDRAELSGASLDLSDERISELRAARDKALAFFCKSKWTKYRVEGRDFAVQACLNPNGVLASAN